MPNFRGNPELRDWLTIYAPWFDDIIAIAYQENMDYGKLMLCTLENIKNYIHPPPKPLECMTEEERRLATTSKIEPLQWPPPPEPEKPPKERQKECDHMDPIYEDAEEESPCLELPPPVSTNNICELEACLRDFAETVLYNYMTARDICKYYNEMVDELVNQQFCTKTITKLEPAMKERLCLVAESLKNASEAEKIFLDLYRYLDCGCSVPKEDLGLTKKLLQEYQDKITIAKAEFAWANERALAEDRHWQQVANMVEGYTSEVKSIFPDIDYNVRRPSGTGNYDVLLNHTHKYLEHYKKEYEAARADISQRADRAFQSSENKDKNKLLESEVCVQKNALKKEYDNRLKAVKTRLDNELKAAKEQAKLEFEAKSDQVLAKKAKELEDKLREEGKKKVEAERIKQELELKGLRLKLAQVENQLNTRLEFEKDLKKAQGLYAASCNLLSAFKSSAPYVNVQKELDDLKKFKEDKDPDMVTTVLSAIPARVYQKGLMPETVLLERYNEMEAVARKVALVEKEGAPLPIYCLSWLQDILLFMKSPPVPVDERDNPLKNISSDVLDNFDLLARARYYMEIGDVAQAVHYVGKMKGASAAAASTWFADACAHMLTKQAALALVAQSTAMAAKTI